MQDSFYRHFLDQNDKVVLFIGGGGKSSLINRICQDCKSLKKTAIITSLFPYITPIESNVLIINDPSIIEDQIKNEVKNNPILFLGKEYDKTRINGYSNKEIKEIIPKISTDHIFIEVDNTRGRSISGYDNVSTSFSYHVDRCINVIGADAFNKSINSSWIESKDKYWNYKNILTPINLASWYKSNTVLEKLTNRSIPFTYFINKVENIFIENLAIPLAKSFKMSGIDRVIVGSVFNSSFHMIKD